MKSKKEGEALKKRMFEFEGSFIEKVRKRILELKSDEKLQLETIKELQKRFRIK